MQTHCITEAFAPLPIMVGSPGEATEDSPLLTLAAGPTRIIRSSRSRSWRGILLEEHHTSPGERTSNSVDRDVVSMIGAFPVRFDYRTVQGHFAVSLNRPGMIMMTPRGPAPDLRLHTPASFIHCALREEFLRGVEEELDPSPSARPRFRPGLQDKAIQRIMGLLTEELETDRPLGSLYVDSLAHALATRYLMLESSSEVRPTSRVSALPARILNRVRERIEADLEADLRLEALAAESGYSRAHFLRMFRAATGMTPHQYVLGLRLQRAQECLREKKASIIDIAVRCGFSSQSHMTTVFRQRLEMTPAEFRRNALLLSA